jgi:hypothetical protein
LSRDTRGTNASTYNGCISWNAARLLFSNLSPGFHEYGPTGFTLLSPAQFATGLTSPYGVRSERPPEARSCTRRLIAGRYVGMPIRCAGRAATGRGDRRQDRLGPAPASAHDPFGWAGRREPSACRIAARCPNAIVAPDRPDGGVRHRGQCGRRANGRCGR